MNNHSSILPCLRRRNFGFKDVYLWRGARNFRARRSAQEVFETFIDRLPHRNVPWGPTSPTRDTLRLLWRSALTFCVLFHLRLAVPENKKPTAGLIAEVGCLRCELSFAYRAISPTRRRTVAATTDPSADLDPMAHRTLSIIPRGERKSIRAPILQSCNTALRLLRDALDLLARKFRVQRNGKHFARGSLAHAQVPGLSSE